MSPDDHAGHWREVTGVPNDAATALLEALAEQAMNDDTVVPARVAGQQPLTLTERAKNVSSERR